MTSAMLSAIAPFISRPSSRRFSVTKAMPLRMLRRAVVLGKPSSADFDLARIVRVEAEQDARELGPARAHQPEDAEDLAGMELEARHPG